MALKWGYSHDKPPRNCRKIRYRVSGGSPVLASELWGVLSGLAIAARFRQWRICKSNAVASGG